MKEKKKKKAPTDEREKKHTNKQKETAPRSTKSQHMLCSSS